MLSCRVCDGLPLLLSVVGSVTKHHDEAEQLTAWQVLARRLSQSVQVMQADLPNHDAGKMGYKCCVTCYCLANVKVVLLDP